VRGMIPFLFPLVFTLVVVTFVPAISLWLPKWLGL